MAVLQDININVYAQPSEKRLRSFLVLSQNENGRTINFRILGSPLPSSCTATLSGTKPDGNVYSTSGIVAGNFVIVQEDIQMTAVAGVWDAKLDIVNGSHNIMTAIIRITVEGDVVAPGSVPSNSQLDGYIAQAKFYAEESRVEAYGSPLTAATKSAMIDKNRVYVYTGSESNMTAGNWYYWNGTAWVSGGVYNSAAVDTDTTLTLPGKAADAKATGDAIEELKEDLNAFYDSDYGYKDDGYIDFPVIWENGGIYNGTSKTDSTTRKRSKDFVYFHGSKQIKVTVPNGKQIYAYYYSSADLGTFVNSVSWKSTDYIYSNANDYYWMFVIADNPEGESRVSENGFAFKADSFVTGLNKKIDTEIDELYKRGSNIFDVINAVEKHALGTDGKSNSNDSYWHTNFMPVTAGEQIVFSGFARPLRHCFYTDDNESAFLSYGAFASPITVPSTAKYMRICFYNTYCPFSERYKVYVASYGVNPSFETYEIFDNDVHTSRDTQYFNVDKGDYSESFDLIINKGNQCNKNMIVSFKGYYTGQSAPTIQFVMPKAYNANYYTSQIYTLGNNVYSDEQEWRVPAFPRQALVLKAIITIPTGTTLHVSYLHNAYDNFINIANNAYRLNAHLGVPCIYPDNTLLSFNCASKLGYSCCVTVPKRTSNGVWVCFHDDSNVGNTLKYPDGTSLSSSDAVKSISDFTYDELMAFSAGAKTSPFYADEKVPTLEAFFALCQKTGMHPMLSCHPVPTASEYAEIKALAEKCNVLSTLNIKGSGVNFVSDAYETFGDSIESYTRDVSTDGVDVSEDTSWFSELPVNKSKIGVEYFDTVITQAKVKNALNNNLFVACYISYGNASRYNELLQMGISEITDDNNCSYGLNW